MRSALSKTVLVAVVSRLSDFDIACKQHWYRIPTHIKRVPKILREGQIEYLAFYHTKVFKDLPFSIKWHAPVKNITKAKRVELLPAEQEHPRKDDEYYKIEIWELVPLPQPIISLRWRRIIFIETTPSQLLHAKEINDLFHGSFIEEQFWKACKINGLDAERELVVGKDDYTFFLDFALMCRNRNLDIECNGDRYHLSQVYQVKRDTKRDNILKSIGWDILRFSKSDIHRNLSQTMNIVKEAVNHYGGLEIVGKKNSFKTFPHVASSSQVQLFKK